MEQEAKKSTPMMTIHFENSKVPEFKEVKGKDWISYGDNNLYPEYLIELALRSAKHSAILSGKVNYIYGGGLEAKTTGASLGQVAKANEFIRQVNSDGFLRKMIQDFEWFNGFYVEPIYNKALNKLVSINYIPFSKIRTNKDETEFYYSNDWKTEKGSNPEKTGFKVFKPFDPEKPAKDQIFYYKLISPKNGSDRNVYPVPEYIGACASIETDVEIANYHLNNIKTGFSVGTIINFNNGEPEEEAKKAIEQSIKRKFQGTDKAGSVAITFNSSSDNAPTITSFAPSDLDKQFIEISKRVEQDIFTGHKITSPMLFGVKTEGQLGGRTEMIDAYELFQNTYVNIRQQCIEDVLNGFARLFGVSSALEFKRVQAVQKQLPDSVLQTVYSAYPVEQLIDILGLPKIKKTQTFSKEVDIEELFSKYGRVTGGTIIKEYPVELTADFDFSSYENSLIEMTFASELSANERAIIDLLSKDSLMPTKDIAKVLKISEPEVNALIKSLDEGGYLKVGDGEITTNKSGENIVKNDGAKTIGTRIEYRYGWRPDVKERNVSHSREFCKNRLDEASAGKTYTSDELISMSNDLGTNVWEFRGGWWNRDGVNVPYCRHSWFAVVKKD